MATPVSASLDLVRSEAGSEGQGRGRVLPPAGVRTPLCVSVSSLAAEDHQRQARAHDATKVLDLVTRTTTRAGGELGGDQARTRQAQLDQISASASPSFRAIPGHVQHDHDLSATTETNTTTTQIISSIIEQPERTSTTSRKEDQTARGPDPSAASLASSRCNLLSPPSRSRSRRAGWRAENQSAAVGAAFWCTS